MLFFILSLAAFFGEGAAASQVCMEAGRLTQFQQQELTPAMRARVVCDLKRALNQKYSLLHLKRDRLGMDVIAHLDSCAATEMATADSRLYTFEDRLLQCLAPVRDSHLSLMAQTPRPLVVSGLFFRAVGQQIVLAGYDKKIIALNEDGNLQARLRPGAVVELIDGLPPEIWAQQLSTYIGASSEGALKHQAVRALGLRDFAYPSIAALALRLSGDSSDIRVNWFVHPMAMRGDVRDYLFSQLGLRSTVALGLERRRPVDGFPADYVGYDERNSLASTIEQTYLADDGTLALQTGFIELAGGPACYLKIVNSNTRKLKAVDRPGDTDRRIELQRFVRICRGGRFNMVVDLRRNFGGDFHIPLEDLALLLPPNSTVPSGFRTGRNTQQLRRALDVYNLGPEFPLKDWKEFSQDRFFRSVIQAEQEGLEHIPAVSERNVQTKGPGYDGSMAVLISPQCFSGCEMMAQALKNRPRTTLIGTPTNGTGGMKLETGVDLINAVYRDDIYSTVMVRIPNAIFGILPTTVNDGRLLPFEQVERQVLENRPLRPDVIHELTLNDVLKNGADLKEVVGQALKNAGPERSRP